MTKKYTTLIIGVFIVLAYITLTQRARIEVNKIENFNSDITKTEMNEIRLKSDYTETTLSLRFIHSKQLKYRNKNGHFARSLTELGLDEESISPENIKHITIKNNGKMHIELTDKFGENIVMTYHPVDSIVKSDERIDMYNDARTPDYLLDEVKVKRSLRHRRTTWKCRTNFKLRDSWCKFVEDLQ